MRARFPQAGDEVGVVDVAGEISAGVGAAVEIAGETVAGAEAGESGGQRAGEEALRHRERTELRLAGTR